MDQKIPTIVRLSSLTMTNPDQMCEVLLFLCSKMRPILAPNCLLQIEQELRQAGYNTPVASKKM